MSYKRAAAQTTEHVEEPQHGLYIQITREFRLVVCICPLSLQDVWGQQGQTNPEFATSYHRWQVCEVTGIWSVQG